MRSLFSQTKVSHLRILRINDFFTTCELILVRLPLYGTQNIMHPLIFYLNCLLQKLFSILLRLLSHFLDMETPNSERLVVHFKGTLNILIFDILCNHFLIGFLIVGCFVFLTFLSLPLSFGLFNLYIMLFVQLPLPLHHSRLLV